ncbi:LysE family translocator [Nocardioides sp. WS12]|uniref:LysE family translocator n=1 Tax=Nocardioides sp. WS12 TaxID=2486272 RepID=UPI0015F8D1F5|nr:LysE family translocator [Nocardioides sp. WS12]
MSTAFLLTSLVICVTPGTGALYAIAAGLTRGTRAGLLAAFAGTLGTIPHMLAAITGLAALLHASGVAFAVLKYAGVAYLLYMAWSTWRDRGVLTVDEDAAGTSSTRAVLVSGITLNLLNPKLTIFFFAFLPQFVPAGPGAVPAMLALSGVFMLMTFAVFALYAAFAAAVRDQVLSRPKVVDRMRKAFAASFAVLAGRLAFESR